MDEKKLMGQRLKKIRKSKDLSQEQVAEKAGLNPKYYGFIEQGRLSANPTLAVLLKIAKALKTDLASLFDYRWQGVSDSDLRRRLKLMIDSADSDQLRQLLAMAKYLDT